MIIPLGFFLVGAVIGALRARARGGKPADMAQWGIVHGILLGLLGLFVLIFLARMPA